MRADAIIAAIAAIGFNFTAQVAAADTEQRPLRSVESLAAMGCAEGEDYKGTVNWETGFVALFGLSDADYAFRVLIDGNRAFMLPTAHCAKPDADAPAVFLMSHFYRNGVGVREGYYYLLSPAGDLLKAVHFLEGRSNPFVMANAALPLIRADFESEKYVWRARPSIATERADIGARR